MTVNNWQYMTKRNHQQWFFGYSKAATRLYGIVLDAVLFYNKNIVMQYLVLYASHHKNIQYSQQVLRKDRWQIAN